MRYVRFFAVFILVMCASCSNASPLNSAECKNAIVVDGCIYRYMDEEVGVVCWYTYKGGISCLPIDQTKLSDK